MFRATAKRLIQFVGKTALEDIKDPAWRGGVKTFCEDMEKEDPKITKAEIRGAEPHKSHDDPTEEQDVISVRFKDEQGKRVATAHIYKNGQGKVIRW
ncbi:hypothetical protein ATERTT37_001800 [Aspergillus terreus]